MENCRFRPHLKRYNNAGEDYTLRTGQAMLQSTRAPIRSQANVQQKSWYLVARMHSFWTLYWRKTIPQRWSSSWLCTAEKKISCSAPSCRRTLKKLSLCIDLSYSRLWSETTTISSLGTKSISRNAAYRDKFWNSASWGTLVLWEFRFGRDCGAGLCG